MSKTPKETFLCLFLVFIFLGLPLNGQSSSEKPSLKPIEKELAEIRKLEFKKNVISKDQSREDFKAFISKELEKSFPLDRREGIQAGLLRLGVLKEKIDLGEEFVNAILSQAAAYYDPQTGTFYYLIHDVPADILAATASHELVHALQDQNFDLKTLMDDTEKQGQGNVRNNDRILAMRFLMEGDATYVQNVWQMKQQMGIDITKNQMYEELLISRVANMSIKELIQLMKMASQMMGQENGMSKAISQMENIPNYILKPLVMAYNNGAYFIMQARRQGGWKAVDNLYTSLPESVEQCLNPPKYFVAKDHPTRLYLPNLNYLSPKWKMSDSAIHGQLYLNILLTEQGVEQNEANLATDGWDGDIYRAYQNKNGDTFIVLATIWDSEADAKEFYTSYSKALAKKYPQQEIKKSKENQLLFSCGTSLGHGITIRRGKEVYSIEGTSPQLSQKIMKDILRKKVRLVK